MAFKNFCDRVAEFFFCMSERFKLPICRLTRCSWKNAVRNPFNRPVKQQLTVRLDADVVAWLRRQGKGYQTRLNQVLREAMLKDIKKSV